MYLPKYCFAPLLALSAFNPFYSSSCNLILKFVNVGELCHRIFCFTLLGIAMWQVLVNYNRLATNISALFYLFYKSPTVYCIFASVVFVCYCCATFQIPEPEVEYSVLVLEYYSSTIF